ncbi:hypothetical protein V8G54_026506 [Vigna mungo]|uniref:Uncharacterized protein n=1 Tax=Vigna mungo TaxID=3915 RepID=A0AAQ3RN90_VIGMU
MYPHTFIYHNGGSFCVIQPSSSKPFQGSPPAVLPWEDPRSESITALDFVVPSNVGGATFIGGLEEQQRHHFQKLNAKGVLWKSLQKLELSVHGISEGDGTREGGRMRAAAKDGGEVVGKEGGYALDSAVAFGDNVKRKKVDWSFGQVVVGHL